jgi:putative Mg2+ transporter-C (MgtC) family protein
MSYKRGLTIMFILDLFFRLVAATIAGAFIGFTRERIQRPAGLRTHALISVGAAFLTELSVTVFAGNGGDPGRIAAQIVSGIGFLGAGTILKKGFSVKGLTTAATLWVTAAVGMGFGSGEYLLSSLVTLIILLVVIFFKPIDFLIGKKKWKLLIEAERRPYLLTDLLDILKGLEVEVTSIGIDTEGNETSLEIGIPYESLNILKKNLDKLSRIGGVKSVDVQ